MMRGLLVVTAVAALTLAFRDVRAAPLDAATCGQLLGEQARLEEGGVRGDMEKGPEWAKANLAGGKLQEIRRLMELDELLLFRCSARNLVDLPPEADADAAASDRGAKEGGKDAAPPKAGAAKNAPAAAAKSSLPKAKTDAAARTKTAPAKKQGSGVPPAAEKAAAPKSKPKSKPKPKAKTKSKPEAKAKVEDAYKPPPIDPKTDPFANRPARQ